jgi:choline-glycine betaine transporter
LLTIKLKIMNLNIKSILKATAFTLVLGGMMTSALNAQVKPAKKQSRKDTVKKETTVKVVKEGKKEQKSKALPASQPGKKQ